MSASRAPASPGSRRRMPCCGWVRGSRWWTGATRAQRRNARTILEVLGADVRLGADAVQRRSRVGTDLVVASPGWRPEQPLLVAAEIDGHPDLERDRARLAAAASREPRRPGSR